MKKTNFSLRLIALLLSLILTAVSIPTTIIAEDIMNVQTENTPTSGQTEENGSADDADPLIEDLSKRDKFTKHYAAPNGERYAVVFSEQVHYEEDGQWVEVDNRMTLNTATQRYETANEAFSANFAANASADSLVSISDGEYSLSWSVIFPSTTGGTLSANATAQLIGGGETDAITTVNNMENMGKAASALRYSGLGGGEVDLRYTVLHGKVEEDIILNYQGEITGYGLAVNTGGLTAEVQESGSVTFSDAYGVIFTIAAPWMMDNGGEISDDILVEAIQKGDLAIISYTPSREWLTDPDRAYPVLIDPSFTTRYYTNNYIDTYTYYGDGASDTRPSEVSMKVGIDASGVEYNPYIKILNIPRLSESYTVTNAKFTVYADFNYSDYLDGYSPQPLELNYISEYWNAKIVNSGLPTFYSDNPFTLTHNSSPDSSLIASIPTPEYDPDESTVATYSFDITEWLTGMFSIYGRTFFEGQNWHGFKIIPCNNGYVSNIRSSESWAGFRPALTIGYIYTPDEIFNNGAIYSIRSVIDNTYLTVSYGEDCGNNVFMRQHYNYISSNTKHYSQDFMLQYVESNNSFSIKSVVRPNEGIKFNFAESINNTTGYLPANIFIGSVLSTNDWIFECIDGNNTYKIYSRSDPNIVLTRATGLSASDAICATLCNGNVYISEYTSQDSQHWQFESAGTILSQEMRDITSDSITTVAMNEYNTTFYCPIYQVDSTVTWSTTNPNVATVNNNGCITVNDVGNFTIKASVSNGNSLIGEYTKQLEAHVIKEGIYYINNYDTNLFISRIGGSNTDMYSYNEAAAIQWYFEHKSGNQYYINSVPILDFGLTVSSDQSYVGVSRISESQSDESFVWTVETYGNDGIVIYHQSNTKTITDNSSNQEKDSPMNIVPGITLESIFNDENNVKSTCVWQLINVDEYINLSDCSTNTIEWMNIGSEHNIQLNISPINASLTDLRYFEISSDNPDIATIGPDGKITAISDGYVIIQIRHKPTNTKIVFSTVIGQLIPNGTYQLSNVGSQKYMDLRGPSNNDGAYIHQWEYHNGTQCNWRFEYAGNGYYNIISAYSNKYVTSDYYTSNNSSITQNAINNDLSLWRIAITSDGNYKFISNRSDVLEDGNRVLSIPNNSTDNGVYLQLLEYADDNNYFDEWIIESDRDASIISIPSNIREKDFIPKVQSSLESLGYDSNVYARLMAMNQNSLLKHMQRSKILVVYTHGLKTSLLTSYGHITTNDIENLDDNAFSNLELVIFVSCLTGEGGESANNFVNAVKDKGAQIVIGFQQTVLNGEAAYWIDIFFQTLVGGKTVEEACNTAATEVYNKYGDEATITTNSHYIVGNKDRIFSTQN